MRELVRPCIQFAVSYSLIFKDQRNALRVSLRLGLKEMMKRLTGRILRRRHIPP